MGFVVREKEFYFQNKELGALQSYTKTDFVSKIAHISVQRERTIWEAQDRDKFSIRIQNHAPKKAKKEIEPTMNNAYSSINLNPMEAKANEKKAYHRTKSKQART
jgi:hypothetical protein